MKIVHVETGRHFYGGAQQVLYLVKGLVGRDIDNTIVCPPGSEIAREAAAAGLDVREIPCHGEFDFGFRGRLRAYLRQARCDLVHAHSRRGADLFAARAASPVPAVVSRRVDSVDRGFVARLRYAGYRRIIAISEHVADTIRSSGIDEERLITIRSAVDVGALQKPVSRDYWLREFGLENGDITIAMAAQFIERKGHDVAIEVFHRLSRAHPGARLLLFGRGPLEPAVRRQVSSMGLDDVVRFAGFRLDLDALLGHADLLLHPAAREGLGVVMLKAAGAGIPVLACDGAGAREAVADGETGILVPPGNAEAMLQALAQLVENPATREQLGSAGKARMIREFSVEQMVDRHVSLYKAIIDERQ